MTFFWLRAVAGELWFHRILCHFAARKWSPEEPLIKSQDAHWSELRDFWIASDSLATKISFQGALFPLLSGATGMNNPYIDDKQWYIKRKPHLLRSV